MSPAGWGVAVVAGVGGVLTAQTLRRLRRIERQLASDEHIEHLLEHAFAERRTGGRGQGTRRLHPLR
jgi:hypothetical protein